jgi:hypothetical protein
MEYSDLEENFRGTTAAGLRAGACAPYGLIDGAAGTRGAGGGQSRVARTTCAVHRRRG